MNRRQQNEVENKALRKLEQELYSMDFSETSHKEWIEERVLNHLGRKECVRMKKRLSLRKAGAFAAAAVIATSLFMQTAVAQEIVNKVIKTVSLGHIEVVQEEEQDYKTMPVPDTLKGKIFTKDGQEVKEFTKGVDAYYTKAGEKIDDMDPETGEILTEAQALEKKNETILVETNKDKINDYTCFTAKLPTYLPEGYSFDRAEYYKDENGKVENSKYINLYFTNGQKEIWIQERFADEETAYCMGTDGKVEEIELKGVKAVLTDDNKIDWEKDGTLFDYMSKGNISKEELIKSAESIQ